MMGSCRNPAAYSNIYGFRPTPGVIASARSDNQKNIPIAGGLGGGTSDAATVLNCLIDLWNIKVSKKK